MKKIYCAPMTETRMIEVAKLVSVSPTIPIKDGEGDEEAANDMEVKEFRQFDNMQEEW